MTQCPRRRRRTCTTNHQALTLHKGWGPFSYPANVQHPDRVSGLLI